MLPGFQEMTRFEAAICLESRRLRCSRAPATVEDLGCSRAAAVEVLSDADEEDVSTTMETRTAIGRS